MLNHLLLESASVPLSNWQERDALYLQLGLHYPVVVATVSIELMTATKQTV